VGEAFGREGWIRADIHSPKWALTFCPKDGNFFARRSRLRLRFWLFTASCLLVNGHPANVQKGWRFQQQAVACQDSEHARIVPTCHVFLLQTHTTRSDTRTGGVIWPNANAASISGYDNWTYMNTGEECNEILGICTDHGATSRSRCKASSQCRPPPHSTALTSRSLHKKSQEYTGSFRKSFTTFEGLHKWTQRTCTVFWTVLMMFKVGWICNHELWLSW
jgi:hypothetical protein